VVGGVAILRNPKPNVMKVNLWLRVEWYSKYVKGQKQAREDVARFVLSRDS
jgi:hypothetical protein